MTQERRKTVALIRDARTSLGIGRIGVLYRGGTSRHQGVLSVIRGVSESVREHEVDAAGHAAANGEGGSVVDTRCCAFENIDRPKLRNGTTPAD